MTQAISDLLLGLITMIVSLLTTALEGIVAIFWTGTAFTFLGWWLMVGFALFFVMFGWRVVQGLIKR